MADLSASAPQRGAGRHQYRRGDHVFQNYLPGQPGTATNLYANASRFGSTAGYLLFGTMAAALGHRGVFAVCALLSAITLGLFLRQRYYGQSTLAA